MPYVTVIPINGTDLSPTDACDFGGGFVLAPLPDWVRTDTQLENLNRHDRESVLRATHGLICQYDAEALGDPDPDWQGSEPRSIQERKYDEGVLAMLSLWLSCPGPANFTTVMHGPVRDGPVTLVQRLQSHSAILCHPQNINDRLTARHLPLAADVHRALLETGREGSLWTAAVATWQGLQMNIEGIRLVLFWVALEALFGPDDAREITYRVSQRIGLFLSEDRAQARRIFTQAKKGYAFRSKVVHGRSFRRTGGTERMAEVESFVRQSLTRILPDNELRRIFSGAGREPYLDDLLFQA